MKRHYYVYIMSSKARGVLYIGVTNNIARRSREHQSREIESFTKRYWVRRLVYVEQCERISDAIRREKNLKAWKRAWKIRLIEEMNPNWEDLSAKLNV